MKYLGLDYRISLLRAAAFHGASHQAAMAYENSAVRRLGYLLEHAGHVGQSKILEPFARKAKSMKPLDPSLKPLTESLSEVDEQDTRWMLVINEPVEIDF